MYLLSNAWSFLVAINAVDSSADVSDLLLLAGTAFTSLLFAITVKTMVEPILVVVYKMACDDSASLASFLLGPIRAIKFLIEKFITVVTHFLSTTLGRWLFVTLAGGNLPNDDVIIVTIVTLTLAWLISVSAGFIEEIQVPTESVSNVELRLEALEAAVTRLSQKDK